MKEKSFGVLLLSLFLAITLITTLYIVQSRTRNYLYIKSDGGVDPPTAPIQRDGETYTFTGDIYSEIIVERDNIVVDGAGYTLQDRGMGTGMALTDRSNVTIKNVTITAFYWGIKLSNCSNITISGNNITTNNFYGIAIDNSDYFIISGNNITNNYYGILIDSSSNNVISENNITNNTIHSIYLSHGSNYNTFFHNSLDKTIQIRAGEEQVNTWDDGYPSGGNYWSNYVDVDRYGGPYQNETGSDGIWDHPYFIDGNNQDKYPLVNPLLMYHYQLHIVQAVQR